MATPAVLRGDDMPVMWDHCLVVGSYLHRGGGEREKRERGKKRKRRGEGERKRGRGGWERGKEEEGGEGERRGERREKLGVFVHVTCLCVMLDMLQAELLHACQVIQYCIH